MKQVKLHFAGSQYGPFLCPEDAEIADSVHRLVNLGPQALQDAPSFSVALPKLSALRFVVVVVQPSATKVEATSKENAESLLQDAYIVEMKEEEKALQLDGIANHLCNVYGKNIFDKDTLRVHNGVHDKGRVLVATRTHCKQPIKPPANQPVVKPSEESPPLSPMTRNGPLAASFVCPVAIKLPTQAKQPWHDTKLNTFRSFSSQRGIDESLDTYKRASSPFQGGVEVEKTCTATDKTTNVESEDAVHLLEHAYNGKCNKMDKCQKPPTASNLRQFREMITAHNQGRLDPDSTKLLQSYILKHCERCTDVSCKVPHMAAGCHKPGMPLVEKVSGASKQPSEEKLLMEKVHALEHVYNGKCFIQKCKKPPSPEVIHDIERMKQAYEEGKLNPQLLKQLKDFVSVHCDRCSDVDCKVPHMMAGCQHPRVPQHLDLYAYCFTDGNKAIAQPTENDDSSVAYRPHYLKPKPVNDVSSADQEEICEATDSHTDESKQESQEWVLENGCFPKSDVLQQHSELRGQRRILYCSQKLTEMTGLTFGSSIAEVDMTKSCSRLGRGGNGNVYECVISGQKFASKQTLYRPNELTIWSGLEHNNVTPLLGVITSASCPWGYRSTRSIIHQLMPRMTGDFQKEVNCFGTLLSLIQSQKNTADRAHVLRNTHRVFREVAAGIAYMHNHQLVHGDLKASNILILRPPACRCAHVLLCTCNYRVSVSDFDSSVYQSDHKKTIKDRIVVLHLGTLFFRAPEAHLNIFGPWCDMWSIGCTLAHLILGRNSAKVKMKRYDIKESKDVYKYHHIPHLAMSLEVSDAQGMLDSLCGKSGACSDADISRLIEVVDGCFNLDYFNRMTAEAMHDKLSLCMKL